MDNEQKIKEASSRLKDAMQSLAPQMELLKAEAAKHKVKYEKQLKDCSISLTESGIIVIKFATLEAAETFYNKL